VPITRIERVIVAVTDLDAACERWFKAGFAISKGSDIARLHAGAVEIDLIAATSDVTKTALERGGGIVGWMWGTDDIVNNSEAFAGFLPGVWTGAVETHADSLSRRAKLEQLCGPNQNTVDYLEHIVVMTPSLEDAIAAHQKIGLPCKRIREAGGGVRQAFFKLEQTVLEIVGPGRGMPQVWGLAFMCKNIRRAVDLARAGGMEATEPKAAIQGGKIARIVAPLDGVAVAYMEAP
jgi:hypothetical protein